MHTIFIRLLKFCLFIAIIAIMLCISFDLLTEGSYVSGIALFFATPLVNCILTAFGPPSHEDNTEKDNDKT